MLLLQISFSESGLQTLVNFTVGWLPAKALPKKEQHLRGDCQEAPRNCRVLRKKLQSYGLRLLSSMARQTGGITIDTQLLGATGAELVLGKHAENRFANHPIGLAFAHTLGRNFLQSTGVTAVRIINLLFDLVAGQADLVGVDDYNVVAGIEVGRESGLILADQHTGDFGRQAAQNLIGRVNHKPLSADF